MTNLSPSDFKTHEDWIAYVRQCVPESEQAYTLANGRTKLFMTFYHSRQRILPRAFESERERVATLLEPDRTAALNELNELMMADLTRLLFDLARDKTSKVDRVSPASPRQLISKLENHLIQKNPYFASYKKWQAAGEEQIATDGFVSEKPGEAQFASAMADLGKLLVLYRDRNQALPPLTFERVWFVHLLRDPERMLQTRAVLGMLTAEIAPCTSA